MAVGFFEKIAGYFSKHNDVRKVADNPAMSAELLLLIKLVFVDKERNPAELSALAHIAAEQFGIEPESLPEVVRYLNDFSYETSTGQAAVLFSEMAPERRVALLRNLITIASADNRIQNKEADYINRVASILNVSPQEIALARGEVPLERGDIPPQ